MWNHENNWGMDSGWGMFIVLLLGTLAFLLLVAYLVRTLAQGRAGSNRPPGGPTAMQVLDERLARGEISVEEYERTKKVLTTDR